eukprot:287496-Rhodomonas_salina.5
MQDATGGRLSVRQYRTWPSESAHCEIKCDLPHSVQTVRKRRWFVIDLAYLCAHIHAAHH